MWYKNNYFNYFMVYPDIVPFQLMLLFYENTKTIPNRDKNQRKKLVVNIYIYF